MIDEDGADVSWTRIGALTDQLLSQVTPWCLDGASPAELRALYRDQHALFRSFIEVVIRHAQADRYLQPVALPSVVELLLAQLGDDLVTYRGDGKFSTYVRSIAIEECRRQRPQAPRSRNAARLIPELIADARPLAPLPGQLDYSVEWYEHAHLAFKKLIARWRKRKPRLKKAQIAGHMPVVPVDTLIILFVDHRVNDVTYAELAVRHGLDEAVIADLIYDIAERFKEAMNKVPNAEQLSAAERFWLFMQLGDAEDDDDMDADSDDQHKEYT